MDSCDRLRGALNTLHGPWWRTMLARLFGRRIESDGHTWARWRGRYYFIR